MKRACSLLLCLLWLPLPLQAYGSDAPTVPAATPPAPRPPSLAQALQALPPASVGDGSVALSVGADRVTPAPPPPPSDEPTLTDAPTVLPDDLPPTPQILADRYGRAWGWFGHVYALAPPTMTVLNTDPTLADLPLSTLASQHPLPFLLGSLTPEQLHQMGATGLVFSDLTPDQQALLKDMLPHPFQIVPKAAKQSSVNMEDLEKQGVSQQEIFNRIKADNNAFEAQTKIVPDDTLYSQVRLRGFLSTEFGFDGPGDESIGVGTSDDGFQTTGAYRLAHGGDNDMGLPGDSKIQAYLRSEIPTATKDGDLEWNRHDLEREVSLRGLKTVDDLVTRLAQATHLELYADAHYGSLPLIVVGHLKTRQPAGDIMQALGLCVCGAWRQVGPAFVLTDDVQGLGTRQEFLREMVQTWSNRMTKTGEGIGSGLRDADWMHTLHFADGDVGALSPVQIEAMAKKKQNYDSLPWKDLPPTLHTALRGQLTRHFDSDNMASFEQTGNAIANSLKPDTSVRVDIQLRLAVSLPETGAMALGGVYRIQMPRETSAGAGDTSAPMNSVALDKPLRGVLCAPKTPDEARAVVARLPKMGLNALFLDVFTNGRTYFPNTALPPSSASAGATLQAALDAARPLHIPVYAVLDTLCWRKDGAAPHPKPWPTGFAEDLTVSGEAPDHAVQRQIDAQSLRSDMDRGYEMESNGSEGWASPLDPKVRRLLPALVRALAGTSGLAGLAFQDTATVGYRNLDYEYDTEGISLGYTPENRLAYLRTYHIDPIDLSAGFDNLQLSLPFEGFSTSFDISLPNFRSSEGEAKDWGKVRGDADKSLLADCFAAAQQAAPTLPLLMRERQIGITFDPWLDPKKPNQYASTNSLDNPFQQITAQSILSINYGPVERAHPGRFVWDTNYGGPAGGQSKRAGGEVLDLVTGGSPDSLTDALDRLSLLLKKPDKP